MNTLKEVEDNLPKTVQRVVKHLLRKTGYYKWGIKRLANRLNQRWDCLVSPSHIAQAHKHIEQWYSFNPTKRVFIPKEDEEVQRFIQQRSEGPDAPASRMDNDNANENRVREEEFEYQDMSLEEYCEWVDLDYDLIDPMKDVKYWTDAKGRRRYSVVPRVDTRGITKAKFIEDIHQALGNVRVPTPSSFSDYNELTEQIIGVLNPTDAHLDKLGFIGKGHTLEDNIDLFINSFVTLIKQIELAGAKKLLFIVGSDLWTTNDARNTTKRGTPQDVNAHYRTSYRAATQAIIECINIALDMDIEIDLIVVEGNHDEDKVFHLGVALQLLYRDHKRVQINYDEACPRQYMQWGRNLLGFGHGYHERRQVKEIPLIMAEEAKKLWAETDFREFFLGDIHHAEEFSFMRTKDYRGVRVRFLRDINQTSSDWDIHHGYHTFPKSTEAFVFHKEKGQIANFSYNL